MKKLVFLFAVITTAAISAFLISSCTSQREMASLKSGAELWAQNCIRCHNIPSPPSYTDTQWKTIGLHMKERANMTDEQITKIVEFLKTAN